MNIIEALRDPLLFGGMPGFKDLASWGRWIVFLKCLYGVPLDGPEEDAIYRHHTERRRAPPPGGFPEAVAIVGRQSGKTRIAGTIVGYEASGLDGIRRESDGSDLYCVLVGQDQRGSMRALLSYAKAPFEQVELLKQQVRGQRADALELSNGNTIAAYPCRPAAPRGLRAKIGILDEMAFYRSTEGYPTDREMLRACRPMLATTGGKLVILSSPYGQSGALYDLYKRNFGRDDSNILIWRGSAQEMNPTLPADYLERMQQDDPDAYRSEVLGEFRAGLTTFIDPEALAACVDTGVRERAPQAGVKYNAHGDPSGGRHDAFTLAISHSDGQRSILDVIRAWKPPFNPDSVIGEVCDLLRAYGIAEIVTDRFGANFVSEGFKARGIYHRASEKDASGLYMEALPLINAKRLVLLDDPDLLREFRGLERRGSSTGRDRVDHRAGEHDDRSVAAAGALVYATTLKRGAAVATIQADTTWQRARWGVTSRPPTVQGALEEGLAMGVLLRQLQNGGKR